MEMLSRRIELEPDNAALLLRRALIHSDQRQTEQAFHDVRAAEALGAKEDALFVRSILHYRLGEFAAAKQLFDRVLARQPGNLRALHYRARLHRDAGQAGLALADYEQLFRRDPGRDPGDYLAAARLMLQIPDRGAPAAPQLLDRRMEQVGPVPQLQRMAIRIERDRGDRAAVIRRLDTLDRATRQSPAWHLEMAESLLRAGQPQAARLHLSSARAELAKRRPTVANHNLEHELETLAARLDLPIKGNGTTRTALMYTP